ncbi:MAG: aldehyde:ferredoxin oxidoreductase, partial [Desulfuromonadales bacterium]|nr:aldehyde:ferredoxin oxidoreductase [Desulfuromonadales bacterium]
GEGKLPEIGKGSMRLSEQTGETDYAYHIKGLELAAYLPETNPGYCWAIAGGHMSMGSYGTLIREGKADVDSWVEVITQDKLHIVGFDMIGLCKFFDITQGIGTQMVTDCLKSDFNLDIEPGEIKAAVRRSFLLGLALEFRQGYTKSEFCLPAEVSDNPNPNIKLPNISNPEFMNELAEKVWRIFDKELINILPDNK